MRVIALLILIFGAGIAGFAAFFASERFQELEAALARKASETQAPAAPQIKTVPVVVAAKPMEFGQFVTKDQLKVAEFPEGSAPANAFASIEEVMGDGGQLRSIKKTMEPGEPVLKAKLTGFGERATISSQLAPGMRAFTLKIDTVSGVAGFLLPNDRVDIFLTRGSGAELSTDLIMQNVKVIAVDQFAKQEAGFAKVARTATVEVSPADAQRLALAQSLGRMTMSLRQINEEETTEEVAPVKIGDVVKIEKQAAPEPEKKVETKRLCVRRGTELVCGQTRADDDAEEPAAADQ